MASFPADGSAPSYFASNIDVVGIYDGSTLQQVFADARPLKASIRETSRVMDQPVESGVMLSDHHIINQREIDLPLLISSDNYDAMYQQLKNAFVSATLLSVQTRTDVYANMIIVDMPHDESPDMYDAITLALRLREVLYVVPASVSTPNAPANYSPADPANANTVNSGQQAPSSAIVPGGGSFGGHGATGAW